MKNNKNFALKALLFTAAIGAGTILYKKFVKKTDDNVDDILPEGDVNSDSSFEIKLDSHKEDNIDGDIKEDIDETNDHDSEYE